MARSLRDQVVVITGASSGVGRACARALGARGARLGLMARNTEALRVAADEVRDLGGEALVLPVDVSDARAVDEAAQGVADRFGRIDTWINCAMVTVFAPVMAMSPQEYRQVTDVTYLGYVHGTMAALRRMLPRDEGMIVQIGSALVYRSIPLQSAYCGAKAAIRGFTDSLRTELLHDGSNIKLSMLQLPAVNTPQFVVQRNKLDRQAQPVPPIYTPERIARAVLWAIEHQPREMIIGGSALKAILAQKVAPGLVDRRLAAMGYEAQQTDRPNDPTRPDNLFEPVPGDHGAHGPYTARSRDFSLQLWLRMNAGKAAAAAGAIALGVAALAARR